MNYPRRAEMNCHFRFTIDGVNHDFECTTKDLQTYFAENYPNYILFAEPGSDPWSMTELTYYVEYQQWVPSASSPHKGEKHTTTVPLTYYIRFTNDKPIYNHFTV